MPLAEHLAYYTQTIEGQSAGLGASGTVAEAVATNPTLNHKLLPTVLASKNLRKKFFENGAVFWLVDYLNLDELTNSEKTTVVKTGADLQVWKKVCSTLWTPALENWTARQIAENLMVVDDEVLNILDKQATSKLRLYVGLQKQPKALSDKDKDALVKLSEADHKKVPTQLIRAYLSAVPAAQKWASENLNTGRLGQLLCGVAGLEPDVFQKVLKWVNTVEGDTKKYSLAALYYNPWADQKYLMEHAEELGFEDMSGGQHERWYNKLFPEGTLDVNRLIMWAKPTDYRPSGRPEAFWALYNVLKNNVEEHKEALIDYLNVISERYLSGMYCSGAEQLVNLADTEHCFCQVRPYTYTDSSYKPAEKDINLSWAIGSAHYQYVAAAIDSQNLTEEQWAGVYAICDSLAPQTSITTLLHVAKNIATR